MCTVLRFHVYILWKSVMFSWCKNDIARSIDTAVQSLSERWYKATEYLFEGSPVDSSAMSPFCDMPLNNLLPSISVHGILFFQYKSTLLIDQGRLLHFKHFYSLPKCDNVTRQTANIHNWPHKTLLTTKIFSYNWISISKCLSGPHDTRQSPWHQRDLYAFRYSLDFSINISRICNGFVPEIASSSVTVYKQLDGIL